MTTYIIPCIDVLLFDEDDDILTASVPRTNTYDYAAGVLNDYMLGTKTGASGTTTISLENVIVK